MDWHCVTVCALARMIEYSIFYYTEVNINIHIAVLLLLISLGLYISVTYFDYINDRSLCGYVN